MLPAGSSLALNACVAPSSLASASRARGELRDQSFKHTGEEDYNYFLTVIFPDSQLQILAYNRIVRDLNGLSKEEFLDAIRRSFTIDENC